MPRIYKPKKELSILSLKVPTGAATDRDGCRLYLFTLAEQMFPTRFEELRKKALPFYGWAETEASDAALEMIVARWVRTLRFVTYPPKLSKWAMLKKDLWVRDLATERVRAWREGEPAVTNLLIGGVKPNAAPRRVNETPSAWLKRNVKARLDAGKVPEWARTLRFVDHFKWFLQHRVGKRSYESLADEAGTATSTVARAVRALAALVDPD